MEKKLEQKELHLVSHTHWDREWYMSRAKHNYRLIKLIDDLLDVLARDEGFRSFHLDGQVILLEDYLAVRPEKEALIKKFVRDGRIKIGPFYILQDEYLISGEATVRNALYGLKECRKYGKPTMIGYFPDAFGNIGQLPQILRGFGIDNAFFGRGIVPTGYANEVFATGNMHAELLWTGADGTQIYGVQFPGWYHNAFQLPHDPAESVPHLKNVIANCETTASTPYLLGMNGCDHQPVQIDMSEVIAAAQPSLDVKLVHSSLEAYLEKIRPYSDRFTRHTGEIEGQTGNGYYTLINTASARIYLKQLAAKTEHLIENLYEPLSVLFEHNGGKYDADMIYYCWKKLLQNFPHDSICGCSVDEVHYDMVGRFRACIDTVESAVADIKRYTADTLATTQNKNVVVFNTGTTPASGVTDCFVDYEQGESIPAHPCLVDAAGSRIPCSEVKREQVKVIVLPDCTFREVHDVMRVHLSFAARNVPATGVQIYAITDDDTATASAVTRLDNGGENAFFRLSFHPDGTFAVTDRKSGLTADGLHWFEETGDKGHEYEYIQCGDRHTTRGGTASVDCLYEGPEKLVFGVVTRLPMQDGTHTEITSRITIAADCPHAQVETVFDNRHDNHRIRVMFDNPVTTDCNFASGQFDLTRRPNATGEKWTHPDNPQRMNDFVMLKDDDGKGLYVAVRGLYEYETARDGSVLGVTLLRCVGELGDWFHFPTSDSQCRGVSVCEYAVGVFGDDYRAAGLAAMDFSRPKLTCTLTGRHDGKAIEPIVETTGYAAVSALKKAENGKGYILRVYNPFPDETEFSVKSTFRAQVNNLNEERQKGRVPLSLGAKKILTLRLV